MSSRFSYDGGNSDGSDVSSGGLVVITGSNNGGGDGSSRGRLSVLAVLENSADEYSGWGRSSRRRRRGWRGSGGRRGRGGSGRRRRRRGGSGSSTSTLLTREWRLVVVVTGLTVVANQVTPTSVVITRVGRRTLGGLRGGVGAFGRTMETITEVATKLGGSGPGDLSVVTASCCESQADDDRYARPLQAPVAQFQYCNSPRKKSIP